MSEQIAYAVVGEDGEYEDYRKWTVAVALVREVAETRLADINAGLEKLRAAQERYNAILYAEGRTDEQLEGDHERRDRIEKRAVAAFQNLDPTITYLSEASATYKVEEVPLL